MTVCNVRFEVSSSIISKLLGITHVPEASTKAEGMDDEDTSASSTGPIDPQADGDEGDDGDQSWTSIMMRISLFSLDTLHRLRDKEHIGI